MFRRGTMVLWAFCFVCSCAAVVSATTYTFYDLGVAGESQSKSYGINSNNVVVGYNNYNNGTYTGYHPSVFNYNGTLTQQWLSPVSGSTAIAWATNSNGVVTGLSSSGNGNQAFYENGNGSSVVQQVFTRTSTPLPLAAGPTRSIRRDRSRDTAPSAARAKAFGGMATPVITWSRLNTMPNVTSTTMYGINNAGLVAGYALGTFTTPYPGTYDAAITWQNGVGYTNINVAIGNTLAPSNSCSSEALAVNNSNEVVGYYQPGTNVSGNAFLYQNASSIVDIGGLGGTGTHAEAISDNGYVVGYGTTGGGANMPSCGAPAPTTEPPGR